MKKIISLFLSLMLAISIMPLSNAHAASDDITGIALEKEMRAMIAKGVISGYSTGVYKPGEKVSRGQFATFISRALNLPTGTHKFSDVGLTSKLAPGINAAAEAGITNGYKDGTFKPDNDITREQMAAMINNAMDYLLLTKEAGSLDFKDLGSINKDFRTAVSYMVGANIIKGYKVEGGYEFRPKNSATRAESAAFIYRLLDYKEKIEAAEDPSDPDTTEKLFNVATINSSGTITEGAKSYATYDQAVKAYTGSSSQVLLYNGKVIKMSAGLVMTKPGAGNSTTVVYTDTSLKTIYGPVSTNNEIEYVSSDADKVTVKVAGVTGYVSHNDVVLLPTQQIKQRSYYSPNSAGELVHHIYNPATGAKLATSVIGKAPASFNSGTKYYSWDAASFTTDSGANAGTYYQYFNMLPARTSTTYTAAQLESYITAQLKARENLYKSNPTSYVRYKDATTKSKLIGLGQIAKKVESEKKINAMLIVAMAIHESDFGMSTHAQTINNIFGIKVFDSDPTNGESYATIEDCVNSLANNYLNKNYVPATGAYANGGMAGSKARGINVRYASDPYWGEKVGGHMYNIDKYLGSKDFMKYTIHETTTSGLNIRLSASSASNANLLFTYKKAGMPVAVLETSNNWHKILSDNVANKYAYVHSNYTKALPIAK